MTTATFGRSAAIVRSDSSPSTTSQPSPVPAFPPSCGTSAPISQAGSRAEPLEAEGDHPARRRLAVRARDDDRVAQGHELGEQLGARLRRAPVRRTRSTRTPPTPRAARAAPPRSSTSIPSRLLEVRRPHAVPAAHLGPPRLREQRVRRSCPRRRSRRSRAAGRSSGEGNELLGDLVRRIRSGEPRHRGRHLARVARDRRAASGPDRARVRPRSPARRPRLRPARSSARSSPDGHRWRRDRERAPPACPPRRAPRPSRRRAPARGRWRRAPRRTPR